jgi:hypothetical protein
MSLLFIIFGAGIPIWFYILPLIAFVLAMWAQGKVKAAYRKYQAVPTRNGLSGAEVARLILESRGLSDVNVEVSKGFLSDHYDPRDRTLRLSEANYNGKSVAACGIAAHEAGHALQHADGYAWLQFRSSMVPVVSIGSKLAMILVPIGLILTFMASSSLAVPLLTVAAYGLAAVVIFSLVTLPVEIDASVRAVRILGSGGILAGEELDGAKVMLRAAAYTYVAAAAAAIMELVRVLMLLAMARGRD